MEHVGYIFISSKAMFKEVKGDMTVSVSNINVEFTDIPKNIDEAEILKCVQEKGFHISKNKVFINYSEWHKQDFSSIAAKADAIENGIYAICLKIYDDENYEVPAMLKVEGITASPEVNALKFIVHDPQLSEYGTLVNDISFQYVPYVRKQNSPQKHGASKPEYQTTKQQMMLSKLSPEYAVFYHKGASIDIKSKEKNSDLEDKMVILPRNKLYHIKNNKTKPYEGFNYIYKKDDKYYLNILEDGDVSIPKVNRLAQFITKTRDFTYFRNNDVFIENGIYQFLRAFVFFIIYYIDSDVSTESKCSISELDSKFRSFQDYCEIFNDYYKMRDEFENVESVFSGKRLKEFARKHHCREDFHKTQNGKVWQKYLDCVRILPYKTKNTIVPLVFSVLTGLPYALQEKNINLSSWLVCWGVTTRDKNSFIYKNIYDERGQEYPFNTYDLEAQEVSYESISSQFESRIFKGRECNLYELSCIKRMWNAANNGMLFAAAGELWNSLIADDRPDARNIACHTEDILNGPYNFASAKFIKDNYTVSYEPLFAVYVDEGIDNETIEKELKKIMRLCFNHYRFVLTTDTVKNGKEIIKNASVAMYYQSDSETIVGKAYTEKPIDELSTEDRRILLRNAVVDFIWKSSKKNKLVPAFTPEIKDEILSSCYGKLQLKHVVSMSAKMNGIEGLPVVLSECDTDDKKTAMTEALANLEFAAFERSFTNAFRNWDRQYLREKKLACKCPLCGNQYNSVQEVEICKEQHEKNKTRRIEKKRMSLHRHKVQNMAKTIQLEQEAEAIANKI